MERRQLERNSDAVSGLLSTIPESGVTLSTEPFFSGEVIGGKYVVERVIGVGGVAVVVAARHLELQEIVAIKILQPEFQKRPEMVQRFSREARAAARIKSEYAARIFDVGVAPGRGPYLVMEYLEGQDLSAVLQQRGPLPVKTAVEFMMQACEALAVAHTNGIIHRDIKPENLFVARRADGGEAIKVLDFGISKTSLTGSIFGGDASPLKTQELMGTPLYMSPEQIRSTSNVDHRADIWSLGVVLYELLSGQLAFHGDAITKICAAVLESDPVPLSRYVVDLPNGLQAVIDRCLKKDPDQRYQNVAELAISLLPFGPSMARVFAERTSTTLQAAGQNPGVSLKFQSSRPPPSGGADPQLAIPTLSGVRPVTSNSILAPAASSVLSVRPSGATLGSPSQGTTASGRPLALEAPLSSPEALNAIAVEGRRMRRIVGITSLLVLGIAATVAAYVINEHRPQPKASATTAAAERPVTIESEPSGARIEWQGKLLGETPLTTSLPIGTHSVALNKEGFSPETLSVTLTAEDTDRHTLRVSLTRVPLPQATAPVAAPSATTTNRGFFFAPQPTQQPRWTPPPRSASSQVPRATAPMGSDVATSNTVASPQPPPPASTPANTQNAAPQQPKTAPQQVHVKVITDPKTNVSIVQ